MDEPFLKTPEQIATEYTIPQIMSLIFSHGVSEFRQSGDPRGVQAETERLGEMTVTDRDEEKKTREFLRRHGLIGE